MESKLLLVEVFRLVARLLQTSAVICRTNDEEADTWIVLHAADATRRGYERMIVCCRDTDVLLLLCVSSNYLSNEVWVKAGTKKMMMKLPILPCAEKLES